MVKSHIIGLIALSQETGFRYPLIHTITLIVLIVPGMYVMIVNALRAMSVRWRLNDKVPLMKQSHQKECTIL